MTAGLTVEDKLFILYVEESPDNFKQKKVNEAIESLACPSLGIVFSSSRLPPYFEDVTSNSVEGINEITSLYRKNYSSLLAIAKSIRSAEAADDDSVTQACQTVHF